MRDINITEYRKEQGYEAVFLGEAKVKKGYYFVDGTESFYRFVGKNSVYSMLELIHPEDLKSFLDTVDRLPEGEQCIIVRMKNSNDKYYCLYMTLWLNGRTYGDFASFTFRFCDIMEITERYETYVHVVKKYRSFMSLSSLLFWEYTFDTDEFIIYQYVNVKSHNLLSKKLETMREEVEASMMLSAKDKAEFDSYYTFLKKGTDRFYTQLDARVIMPDEEENIQYQIKGSTMYREGVKSKAVGIFNVCGKKQKKTSYYLTDSALDPGTGLLNKRAINEYALEKIQECEQEQKSFYLAVVDIDDFKKINDTYGHMFGDSVISKVTEIVQDVLDTRGVMGRFGGDEFMLVIENVEDEERLRRITKTIGKHMQWEYEELQDTLKVTTSWGIAKYPDNAASFEELFEKADKALYIAKAKGKNRIIIYDETKHGGLESKEGDSRDSGIRMIASDEKKAAVMTELVAMLYQQGQEAFSHVMETMCAYFDLDGIAVYQGKEMKRICSYGKYVNPIQALPQICDKQYLEFFDNQRIYEGSDIKRLSNSFPDIYNLYEQQENGKFIQCLAMEDGVPTAMVSYDFFNRHPKMGVTDMGLMKIVGRLMAEIAGANR